ncbi:unnamed protein product [Didymodactylos carnosus]|uniref:Amine oxidase domain-containing protein n=1 Tax=Didymodactylos carnosus TaxID=1234261 RepID=A0A8S2E146_9BILA|nr:unnamed protein product [Didymodactylos carnosus]CAF3790911.1 unnamed protein product [Didymodactylos carnosus]
MFSLLSSDDMRLKRKSPDELWNEAMKPILNTFETEDWSAVENKWDKYSLDSYLNEIGLSRAAIDYMALMLNFETNLFTSVLEGIRDRLMINDDTLFYHIQGGNDLLIESLKSECLLIENKRCSIVYNTEITKLQLYDQATTSSITVTWKANTSEVYDSVIVSTTAKSSQLIEFNEREDFLDKYRSMRQLHYDCASKIILFFNYSWWLHNENIHGGCSITDLPIRFIYYYNFNDQSIEQDGGGAIIASYTWSQDSMLWQSVSEQNAIDLALKQIMEIHRLSFEIQKYFQGGKIKHWCDDEYTHGAFALFTPLQDSDIFDDLQASVFNVHFMGEHTSTLHGWIEGSLLSAVRTALVIQEETFDVVIIGGGPIGLTTAVSLWLKQPTLRIVILEQYQIGDSQGSSSAFDVRQFRQMYNEPYLAELANLSFSLWRQLENMANLSYGSILNSENGYLFYGDFSAGQNTVEGDLASIEKTCKQLQMDCLRMNNSELKQRFSSFTFQQQYEGLFHNKSGFINVTTLMKALYQIIIQTKHITIRENEQFLSVDNSTLNYTFTRIITNRGSIIANNKVLFVPGPYAKNISLLLNFNLNLTLWEVPIFYFRLKVNNTKIPTWFIWGGNDPQSLYAGFPIDQSTNYITVLPNFIKNLSNPLIYPSQRTNVVDPFIIKKVVDWVALNMPEVISSDYYFDNKTCLATFLPDNGFILDYVPNSNRKILLQAAGWGMKFVPVWADILSSMILDNIEQSTYAQYMPHFSLSLPYRMIEKPEPQRSEGQKQTAYKMDLLFIFLCCWRLIIL